MDDEAIKELEGRKAKFLEGYGRLREECQVDIFFKPEYIPDGKGGFQTVVYQNLVDLKNMAVPSKAEDFL